MFINKFGWGIPSPMPPVPRENPGNGASDASPNRLL